MPGTVSARWGAPVAHNSQQISRLAQNIPDVGRAFILENKLAEEAIWASHKPQRHVSSIFFSGSNSKQRLQRGQDRTLR